MKPLLRAAAGVVPVAQLARLGMPALIALVALAVLMLVTGWWILADDARTARAVIVMQAWRGRLAFDADGRPAARDRKRRRRRRRPPADQGSHPPNDRGEAQDAAR
jgi:Mg-chelatase subunit ChlI